MQEKIKGGIYLVVDPSFGAGYILPKIEKAIQGGVNVLQVWNNWTGNENKIGLIDAICAIAHQHAVPVLINEEWQLMRFTGVDGVHFDAIPTDLGKIRETVGRGFITGITCGNDLSRVDWAIANDLDYISFCSIFPSPSAGSCEIVKKEIVGEARRLTSMPIFVAGGITPANMEELDGVGINGVALISAIMKADRPEKIAKQFSEKLAKLKNN
jgi:thiamine-phosphate pyrophosphorylase